MPPLSEEQHEVLFYADKHGVIREGDYEVCPGIHFCRNWDEMAVCRDSPEAVGGCGCGRITESN